MAILTVTGEPGCRVEEIARLSAQRLDFQLVTDSYLRGLIADEFGSEASLPEKAWPFVAMSILAHVATEHPLVVCMEGAELLFDDFPGLLRAHVTGVEARRIGMLMLEHRLERPSAKTLLRQLEHQAAGMRKNRFGRSTVPLSRYDLVFGTGQLDSEHIAALVSLAVESRGMLAEPLLSKTAEAQIQFRTRLRLAKFGIAAPGKVQLKRSVFANQSEEIFANLLDFYRIGWEYEPKSFPIQWDRE
ncbi:MAG: hypothetical protein HYZ37_14885, partial [Candidatus Solibacter usitatus]|nr:hypothetical protein [Candidatus Solibacter usitatus]